MRKILLLIRDSFLGELIVRFLIGMHNFSYNWISFFAVEKGVHPKHRLTNYHKFFLDRVSANETVVDIGCGKGELSYDLAGKAKLVTGIDIDKRNIEAAQKNFSKENIEYICGDATKEFKKGSMVDVVVLSNVLEHIKDRVKFLKELAQEYSGAKFLIRVPMINRDWLTLYKKELGAEWRLDKTHFTEYTLGSFTQELKEAGLFLEEYSIQFGEIWAVVKIKNTN